MLFIISRFVSIFGSSLLFDAERLTALMLIQGFANTCLLKAFRRWLVCGCLLGT
jgi:hypothetical protein